MDYASSVVADTLMELVKYGLSKAERELFNLNSSIEIIVQDTHDDFI